MADRPNQDLGDRAEQKAHEAARSETFEKLARLGFAAKGTVYVVIGVLAVKAALGAGGETTGSEGALRTIAQQPFGQVLLVILAIGLVGYSIWRLVEALLDPADRGTDAEALAKRTGFLASSIIYASLAFYAAQLVLGSGDSSGDGTQQLTAKLMSKELGVWLVGLLGLAILVYAFYEGYRAYTEKFREHLALGELDANARSWVIRLGRAGLAARSVVFFLIGIFMVKAAIQTDPSEARGLEGALDTLAANSYGPWLLGLVGLGLLAYGVYSLIESRYREI